MSTPAYPMLRLAPCTPRHAPANTDARVMDDARVTIQTHPRRAKYGPSELPDAPYMALPFANNPVSSAKTQVQSATQTKHNPPYPVQPVAHAQRAAQSFANKPGPRPQVVPTPSSAAPLRAETLVHAFAPAAANAENTHKGG